MTLTTLIGNEYKGYVTGVEETKKDNTEILIMDVADFNVNYNEATDVIEFDAISRAVKFFKSAIMSIEIVDNPKLDDYVGKYVELTTQSYTRFKGRVNAVQYDKNEACILLEVNDVHEWLTTDMKVAFEPENTSQCYLFRKSEIIAINEWIDDSEGNTTCKQER
ncbi:hypothetical protein K2V61_01760 [Staphylococcus simulans]|uniref:hypothetical protein n=1 Tax=Staphylococcus simulans TaxID=1286 RepID=UPI001E37F2ED|nr:hypothetical protein [Staphylococcus simulans]MCD8914286.1 hypothetical protein [Staphylococcus simulans]